MARDLRGTFLDFAKSTSARWTANFRDLNAAVTRMATLAPGGRITRAVLDAEIARLRNAWHRPPSPGSDDSVLIEVLGPDRASNLDLFDRAQLACVIRVCQSSGSLSEAGRALFGVSRENRKVTNDADRLRKYLARFGVAWDALKRRKDQIA
jgi:transcriptional regulatory protein RtcR